VIPTVTEEQLRLLERASENLLACAEVLAPLIGTDAATLVRAFRAHGARRVLLTAGFALRK
jgi:phosphoserine phosphatase